MDKIIRVSQLSVKDIREIIAYEVSQKLGEYNLQQTKEKKLISRLQTAKQLKVTPVTIDTWRKKGFIKAYKIGGKVFFKETDIEAAIKEIRRVK